MTYYFVLLCLEKDLSITAPHARVTSLIQSAEYSHQGFLRFLRSTHLSIIIIIIIIILIIIIVNIFTFYLLKEFVLCSLPDFKNDLFQECFYDEIEL